MFYMTENIKFEGIQILPVISELISHIFVVMTHAPSDAKFRVKR